MRVRRDGVELDPGPPQQALLLALLLARCGHPMGVHELISAIWEEDIPSSARNIIQKYVGALRRLIEPGLALRDNGSFLRRHGDSYSFTGPPDILDLVRFRQLVAAARADTAGHRPEAALDSYVEALALWHGPAGDGVACGTRATPIFAAIDDDFYDTCVAAAELAVSLRRPEPVLRALQTAAAAAPFHEPMQAALVRVLGAAGRQAEALSVYRTVRERLADELGIDPGPPLEEAHRSVLGRPTSPPVEPPAVVVSALVGRARELAVLRAVAGEARAGRTAVGIVEGEPGVGKTMLVKEAAADAGRLGALTVWGACLPGDGTPSLWPWEQALGAVVDSLPPASREKWRAGDLGRLLEPRDDDAGIAADSAGNGQFRLFELVVGVVGHAVAQRPVLLVLDDLQWADTASLRLFGHLAGRLPGGCAVIGILRDRAPVPGSDLAGVLAAAGRLPGHRRIRLGPLRTAEVAELVRRETGHEPDAEVARTIHARTAGNPFFARELARMLSEGEGEDDVPGAAKVPSTVRDVVRDRMAVLGDQARELLYLGAVIGLDIDLGLLARAAVLEVADCWEQLRPSLAQGMIETRHDDPSAVRFAHDLVRESVLGTTPPERVPRLHLAVADALELTHADDESAVEPLAYHLWAAGPLADPARAGAALMRAGHRAAVKFAFEAAARHLQSAARIARAAGLPELELSALSTFSAVARRQASYAGPTVDLVERAAHLATRLGRPAEAADHLYVRLNAAYFSGERDRSRWAHQLSELGRSSDDPVVQVTARQAMGLHHWDQGDIAAAYLSFSGNDYYTISDGVVSRRPELALRRDIPPGGGPGWHAVVTALHGDPGAAYSFLDAWDEPGNEVVASIWVYYTAMVATMAGDLPSARRAVERWTGENLERVNAERSRYVRQYWHWVRALSGDDPASAAAEAQRHLASTLLDPPRWGIAYHHALVAEMWLAAERPHEAGAALARAAEALDEYDQRYAEGHILLVRARLLLARGASGETVRAAAEAARARSAARGAHLFARRAESLLAGIKPDHDR
ncbi:ATP-binding protein [Paractinoplanes brasiliensis]|uniref:ATP-binding protein n=1 Tax=Paractinoplanes brasiliensis TaxID=52695 RepID=UPI00105C0A6D|nr:BTAD domain-containing putative transcriptional regulator [Actinoplanes brasiliensis]